MSEIETILKMSDRDLIRAVLEQMRNAGLRSPEYFALVGRLQNFSNKETK
jgi:hypothetical protein